MADLKYELADDIMNAVCQAAEGFEPRSDGPKVEAVRVSRVTTLQTMVTVRTTHGPRQFFVKLSESL